MLVLLSATQLAPLHEALAQPMPVGPQIQVNSYTTGFQRHPAVAVDGAGNIIVVWSSDGSAGSDTYYSSIQAQRYDAEGAPLGSEFQVNSYTTYEQYGPAVAADAMGIFVVVWINRSNAIPVTTLTIQAQRFDNTGAPQGSQFQVNPASYSEPHSPAIAADAAGNFVVVWEEYMTSIQGRRYNGAGTPLGGQFQVNSYTTGAKGDPGVASDSAGNFVVVWKGGGSAGSEIQGQRFNGMGTPQGSQFAVDTYTTGSQASPDVAVDGSGNFVVVWSSIGSPGSDVSTSIQGQRYDSAGAPLGSQFQVNSYTTNPQFLPAVAADAAGNFVVVWTSIGSDLDTDGRSVQGQRYDSAGMRQGAQFQVNSYSRSDQSYPAVANDPTGRFVAVWASDGSPGSDISEESVQGQRFSARGVVPGRIAMIRQGVLAKFVARPNAGGRFTFPAADPVTAGGSLRVFDVGVTAGDDTYNLPAGSAWQGLGSPAGSKGYKYRGAGTTTDPCKVVLVKERIIKAACKGIGVTLTPPFAGDVGIDLSLGTTDRYCAQFGGDEVRNDANLTKRKNAPAPGACL
jgi:hypothetical protein